MIRNRHGIVICLLILSLIFMFAACDENTDTRNMEKNTYKTEGKLLEITLEANSTTGYTWQYEISDDSVIVLSASEYFTDEHKEGMTGVGGTKQFYFEGIREGNADIILAYYRTWEKEEYKKDYILSVTVDENLSVIVENISSENGKMLKSV